MQKNQKMILYVGLIAVAVTVVLFIAIPTTPSYKEKITFDSTAGWKNIYTGTSCTFTTSNGLGVMTDTSTEQFVMYQYLFKTTKLTAPPIISIEFKIYKTTDAVAFYITQGGMMSGPYDTTKPKILIVVADGGKVYYWSGSTPHIDSGLIVKSGVLTTLKITFVSESEHSFSLNEQSVDNVPIFSSMSSYNNLGIVLLTQYSFTTSRVIFDNLILY